MTDLYHFPYKICIYLVGITRITLKRLTRILIARMFYIYVVSFKIYDVLFIIFFRFLECIKLISYKCKTS